MIRLILVILRVEGNIKLMIVFLRGYFNKNKFVILNFMFLIFFREDLRIKGEFLGYVFYYEFKVLCCCCFLVFVLLVFLRVFYCVNFRIFLNFLRLLF